MIGALLVKLKLLQKSLTINTHICLSLYMHICIYFKVYIYKVYTKYIYIKNIYIFKNVCTHIYMCVCVCIYVCVCLVCVFELPICMGTLFPYALWLFLHPVVKETRVYVSFRSKGIKTGSCWTGCIFIGQNMKVVVVSSSSVWDSRSIVFINFLTVICLLSPCYFPFPCVLFHTLKFGFAWLTRWCFFYVKNALGFLMSSDSPTLL